MAKFDKTFPTLDCAACILTPKMSSVLKHPNITLWTYSEVSNVAGFVGNYQVTVTKKPRYIIEELCVGCNACIDQCIYKEGKFADEFNVGLSKRKPVYMPFPQATPLVVVVDDKTCIHFKTGKCPQTCATHSVLGTLPRARKPRRIRIGHIQVPESSPEWIGAGSPSMAH